MKAIVIRKNGGPDVLQIENREDPKPEAGEVVVKVHAAGVNFVDIYHRSGTYAAPSDIPFVPGLEGAGVVEAIGPKVNFVKVGDRVAYTGQIGSYAEKNLVRAEKLIPIPETFSFEQAAAFPLQGMTAHYLLHEFRKIEKGTKVLIHAAAGGMGLLLTQWAKHLGAYVIGTVSTEDKAKSARAAGADEVIIYTKQNFVQEALRITSGHGLDLIIDGVGNTTLVRDFEALAVRGVVVLYGYASGIPDPIDPRLLMPKSLTLASGSLNNFLRSREELLSRSEAVIKAIQEGWLKLKIERIYTLEQAKEAHRALEGRKTSGKLILKII